MITIDLKTIMLATLFVFFLNPITLGVAFSANYFFLLFPLLFILRDSKIYSLQGDLKGIFIIYCIIFFLAAIFQYSYWELLPRKLTSFILFITLFSFAIIDLSQKMIDAFKLAIIIYITYLSLGNLNELRTQDLASLGYAAKNQVGNQRYGFFYILSFWLVFFLQSNSSILRLAKLPLLVVIFLGLLLTFSRASVVGLIGSVIVFFIVLISSKFKLTTKNLGSFILYGSAFILLLVFTGLYEYVTLPFEYFIDRLFSTRFIDGTSNFDLSNPNSSEGYRIFLILSALQYAASSPFFGSGFLGIWIILDDGIGSAHGQYNDMLFRTGFFGLTVYLFFLFKLGKYLYKTDLSLFMGFVGVLIFGLFHETFKLSQGAFLLAFLVGMWAQSLRKVSK